MNNSMSNEEKLAQAQQSAQKWLDLVDRSEYEASWWQTAPYFQNNVTKAEWQKTLQGIRQPLGEVLAREVASLQYTTSLPGSPDGEYIVIQYNTSFEHKRSAIKTIVLMLDLDRTWKTAGYFIK